MQRGKKNVKTFYVYEKTVAVRWKSIDVIVPVPDLDLVREAII